MATPIVTTDGTSDLNAALLNRYLAAGGTKTQVKALWARIRYTGAAWEVPSTTDSAELVAGNLTWDAGNNRLNVALSGFTVIPVVLAVPFLGDSIFWPKVSGASTTQAQIAWYNDAGTRQTVQSSNMDVYVIMLGV